MDKASPVFRWLSDSLEKATSLDSLQARGTLRLALRRGGLDAKTIQREEMVLLLKSIMPRQLRLKGVADSERLCESLAGRLEKADLPEADSSRNSPEEIFKRVFGDRDRGLDESRLGLRSPRAVVRPRVRRYR